jgi:hypothetical protein
MKVWPFNIVEDLRQRIEHDRELAWNQWHKSAVEIYDLQKRIKVLESKQGICNPTTPL